MLKVVCGNEFFVQQAKKSASEEAPLSFEHELDELISMNTVCIGLHYSFSTAKQLKKLKLTGKEQGIVYAPGEFIEKMKNAEVICYKPSFDDAKDFLRKSLNQIDDKAIQKLFGKLGIRPKDTDIDFFQLQNICSLLACEKRVTETVIEEYVWDEPKANAFQMVRHISYHETEKAYELAQKIIAENDFSAMKMFGILEKVYRLAYKECVLGELKLSQDAIQKTVGVPIYNHIGKDTAKQYMDAIKQAKESVKNGAMSEQTAFVMLISYMAA